MNPQMTQSDMLWLTEAEKRSLVPANCALVERVSVNGYLFLPTSFPNRFVS
jgi:hypothetical protein